MHQFKDTWIDSLSAPRIPELHWRLLRKHNDALVSEIDTARVKNSSKRVLEVLGCRGVFQWWCRLSSTIANPDTHRYVVLFKNYPTLSSKLSNNWAVSYTIRLKVIKKYQIWWISADHWCFLRLWWIHKEANFTFTRNTGIYLIVCVNVTISCSILYQTWLIVIHFLLCNGMSWYLTTLNGHSKRWSRCEECDQYAMKGKTIFISLLLDCWGTIYL